MILLEQSIELKIYHNQQLRKYDVVELLEDDKGMSFEIFYKGNYLFTLIPFMNDYLSFKLSGRDKKNTLDWSLYLKIEASLYSIFLTGPVS